MAQRVTLGTPGAPLTTNRVARVATEGREIGCDNVALDRVKKELGKCKEKPSNDLAGASLTSARLTPVQARAVIVGKVAHIVQGKCGVRREVIDFFVELLNLSINDETLLPSLPSGASDAEAFRAVADVACGDGMRLLNGNTVFVSGKVEAAGLKRPGITAPERTVFEQGACGSAAVAALSLKALGELLPAAEAFAALSCEALQADTASYSEASAEARAHKSEVAVAEDLRLLLEGSKCVNPRKRACQLWSVKALPQLHGRARDTAAAAAAAVATELASGAAAPPPPPSPALHAAAAALLQAVAWLVEASSERVAAMAGELRNITGAPVDPALRSAAAAVAQGAAQVQVRAREHAGGARPGAGAEDVPSMAVAVALADAAAALQSALAAEGCASLALLAAREVAVAAKMAEVAAKAAAANSGGGEEGAGSKGKGGGKDGKKGRGGGGPPALGQGSAVLKEFVAGALAGGGGAGALAAAVDPAGRGLANLNDALRAAMEANQAARVPKIPKGTRDFSPEMMAVRELAFGAITGVFKRHGAGALDTPVFELKETLMGKYGEDSKLIYDLADQGGEILSLRYDLTVPFARYLATNRVEQIKRYHIARVYRRDQPAMNRGRYREFYQCDFDIAGSYAPMVPDAEVLKVLTEILDELKLGNYEIKLNHRKVLDATLALSGVPASKFRTICSAVDKLDKSPWEEVREEMIQKGLDAASADKVGSYVVRPREGGGWEPVKGRPWEMLQALLADKEGLAGHPEAAAALEEMKLLFGYLEAMGALHRISLDLSLARGLDYYTGLIYEAVFVVGEGGGESEEERVGSIAAGGRYDNLVGMFSKKQVPAVGVSIGIERVFAILQKQQDAKRAAAERALEAAKAAGATGEGATGAVAELAAAQEGVIRKTQTQVLVASIGGDMIEHRMRVCNGLWAAGIKAEFMFKANPKMQQQLEYANQEGIPLLVYFGEDELAGGQVKLKNMATRSDEVVPMDRLVEELAARGVTAAGVGVTVS